MLTVTSAARPDRAQQNRGDSDDYGRFGKRHPANGTIHGGSPCYAARRFSPSRPAMVPRNARRTDRRAASRLGVHSRRPSHAHRRADRIRQDARGVPLGARRPLPREPRRPAARRSPRGLRVAAEGAERRHSQEPGRAAPRHPPARRTGGAADVAHHGGRPDRRHAAGRARRDAAHAAAHPGDDAGIALPAADVGAQPQHAAHRANGHRRRDPRGHRHAARRPPGAVARAPAAGVRRAAAAARAVRHAEAARRGRAFPRRRPAAASRAPSSTRGIAGPWISASSCRAPRSTRSWPTRSGRSTTTGSTS